MGFATYDEVKKAVEGDGQQKLDLFGDVHMPRIEESAEVADRAFQMFRAQQTEHNMDAAQFKNAKAEVRQRLKDLNDELSRYLARQYGVNLDKVEAFEDWLSSHHPFHWFVEFYKIIKSGGFDIIIGNPPYVEYKNVKEYKVVGYQTLRCGDLYAYTSEQSYSLLAKNGCIGLIVPISIFGTDGFELLQKLSLSKLQNMWVSCFANRPSQLFDGAQKRLTILLGRKGSKSPKIETTSYLRWIRKEWPFLFSTRIQYARAAKHFAVFPASLEKLGTPIEVSTFSKLISKEEQLSQSLTKSENKVYYTRKFGYFLAFLDFVPEVTEVSTGQRKLPSELKSLSFDSPETAIIVAAVLSSSTFFWFWNVLSDCRNLNRRDLLSFPFDPDLLSQSARVYLLGIGCDYMKCLQSASKNMTKSGLLIQTFEYATCKSLLNEIDHVLAQHYELAAEELDLIINYDIKYRMGFGTFKDR